MVEDEDLPEDCYAAALADELCVGDICRAVPFTRSSGELEFYLTPETRRDETLIAARWLRGVVLRVYDDHAVVAPISTRENTRDIEEFDAVAEAGRAEQSWVRLPELKGEWEGPAIAFLFTPHSIPAHFLLTRRAASLTDAARDAFASRVARAFEP